MAGVGGYSRSNEIVLTSPLLQPPDHSTSTQLSRSTCPRSSRSSTHTILVVLTLPSLLLSFYKNSSSPRRNPPLPSYCPTSTLLDQTSVMDKEKYAVNESPTSNGHNTYVDHQTGHDTKTGRINEAAGLYGDLETAEEYGYVTRGYV